MSMICATSISVSNPDSNDSSDICVCGTLRLIDPAQACSRLHAQDEDLLRMVNEGLIPAYRIGPFVRVCEACVDKLARSSNIAN